MKKINLRFKILFFLSALIILHYGPVKGQDRKWEDIDKTGFYKEETTKRGKFTLRFINKDPNFSLVTQKRLTDLFFKVYPTAVAHFNPRSSKNITFVIGEWKGVAATVNDIIKFDPAWFAKNPEDIDCATHELIHVIQAYPLGIESPGWLTEGIADFGRNMYGINNARANWKLEYAPGQNYTDSYRTTGRFLVWVDKHHKDFVVRLNNTLAAGRYSDKTWLDLTGKSVDELWYLYINDHDIS